MLIEAEISSRELIEKLLEHHSIDYILQTIAEQMSHPAPNDFSSVVSKLFWDGLRGEDDLSK